MDLIYSSKKDWPFSNIYVKIDPSISNNKLEIKNDDVSFSSSNCDEYLSLLENGTIS